MRMPDIVIGPAKLADIPALVALESRVFETDRISRRSFRRFIASGKDDVLVARANGALAGYALVSFRAGTALARLYSIAVAPEHAGHGVGRALVEADERAAMARDCLFLRLEVREDNIAAIALYRSAGYRQFARVEDYYEDHGPALRFEKRLVAQARLPRDTPPYIHQTTDFTCGSACMMMALAWAIPSVRPSRALELRLWRDATTIFMTSGLGGCDPYGLAVTLTRRGLACEVRSSHAGPFFLDGVRSAEKKDVMRVTQEEFRRDAAELGIPTGAALGEGGLSDAFGGGAVAIVLVSGYRMFRKKVPHWVLAYGQDSRHVFVHDPWIESAESESFIAAAHLPIPTAEFHRMARFGRDNLRAAVLVRKAPRP